MGMYVTRMTGGTGTKWCGPRDPQYTGPVVIRAPTGQPGNPTLPVDQRGRPFAGVGSFLAACSPIFPRKQSPYGRIRLVGGNNDVRGRTGAGLLRGADRWRRLQHDNCLCRSWPLGTWEESRPQTNSFCVDSMNASWSSRSRRNEAGASSVRNPAVPPNAASSIKNTFAKPGPD